MRRRTSEVDQRGRQWHLTTVPSPTAALRQTERTAVLAAVLSALTLLSVVALPVVAAGPPSGNGPPVTGGGNGTGGNSGAGIASLPGGGGFGATGGGIPPASTDSSPSLPGEGDPSPAPAGSNGNQGNAGPDAESGTVGPAPGGNGARPDAGTRAGGGSNGNGNGEESGMGNDGGPGPAVEVTVGPPSDPGGGEADPGAPASDPSGPSVVTVEVEDASAGGAVSIDVSPPPVEDEAVAFDGIDATVEREGDFTMRVTSSRERLPGSPAFEPGDGAEALGRVRLDHSISNEDVSDVSFTFRVSKTRLDQTDTDPEDVALYRHADGSWSALPTDVVGETPTHYLLRADSSGMSEFAVGAMRPVFDTWWANVESGSARAGDPVAVSGRVTNVGGADGVFDATLAVDGEVVAVRQVTVAAEGTRQVNFRAAFDRPGTYRVSVDGTPAGTITVRERAGRAERGGSESRTVALDRILDFGWGLPIPTVPTSVWP